MNAANRVFVILFLGLLLPLPAQSAGGHSPPPKGNAGDIAIVVNTYNAVTDLSLSDLRKIFRGETQYWKANGPIFLIVPSSAGREHVAVMREMYQMSDVAYRQYWAAKLFRGEAVSLPTELDSSALAEEGVHAMPGAIACIDAQQVRPEVKVVRIDGHLPGEQGYPLHGQQ